MTRQPTARLNGPTPSELYDNVEKAINPFWFSLGCVGWWEWASGGSVVS